MERAFDGICEAHDAERLVFLFDELPYMLQKIAVRAQRSQARDNAALDILDILRSKRMEHGNLRMVFAGSVGLHHVLAELRGDAVASEPLNDMHAQPIGPLAPADAVRLTSSLLRREDVLVADGDRAALEHAVAVEADNVSFYIEKVVGRLAEFEMHVQPSDAERIVRGHLSDDRDDWQMEHFRSRLRIYYPGHFVDATGGSLQRSRLAETVLDVLSVAPDPMSIDDVNSAVKAALPLDDRARIVRLLKTLALDNYLICDDRKRYQFRFPLVRRWWVLAQGLDG